MAYQHARKAGNLADVWKHFTLLTVLADLVADRDAAAPSFAYLETHCGEGLYELAPDGEWRNGVARVLPVCKELADHPYFEALGSHLAAGSVYRGSWLLVADYLGRRRHRASLSLHDTDPAVARRLQLFSGIPHTQRLRFRCGDGYAALRRCGSWDLVFIDPPYSPDAALDYRRVAVASRSLASRHITFLAWYPLLESSHGWFTATGVRYELLMPQVGKVGRRGLTGCGMLAGGRAARSLAGHRGALAALATHVGARFRVRPDASDS